MAARAIGRGSVIAESDSDEQVGGTVYPPASAKLECLEPSDYHTTCPWKGRASYYHVAINGDVNENAAWYCPDPKVAASHIKDDVAFWQGIQIEK